MCLRGPLLPGLMCECWCVFKLGAPYALFLRASWKVFSFARSLPSWFMVHLFAFIFPVTAFFFTFSPSLSLSVVIPAGCYISVPVLLTSLGEETRTKEKIVHKKKTRTGKLWRLGKKHLLLTVEENTAFHRPPACRRKVCSIFLLVKI